MDDKTRAHGNPAQTLSGFDRRSFMAGAAGTAVLPLTVRAAAGDRHYPLGAGSVSPCQRHAPG